MFRGKVFHDQVPDHRADLFAANDQRPVGAIYFFRSSASHSFRFVYDGWFARTHVPIVQREDHAKDHRGQRQEHRNEQWSNGRAPMLGVRLQAQGVFEFRGYSLPITRREFSSDGKLRRPDDNETKAVELQSRSLEKEVSRRIPLGLEFDPGRPDEPAKDLLRHLGRRGAVGQGNISTGHGLEKRPAVEPVGVCDPRPNHSGDSVEVCDDRLCDHRALPFRVFTRMMRMIVRLQIVHVLINHKKPNRNGIRVST